MRHGKLWFDCEESRENFLAIVSKDGLGMELHTVHGEFAMTERHDFSVVAFCSDFETTRQ